MYSWVFAINWNTSCPLQLPMRTTPLGKRFLFLKHSNAHGITLPIPTRALRVYHVQCFCQEPTLSLITKKDLSKRVWLGLYLWVYFCLLFFTRGSRSSSLAPSDVNGPLCLWGFCSWAVLGTLGGRMNGVFSVSSSSYSPSSPLIHSTNIK